MTTLEWHRPQDQIIEAGLDRGVLYVEDGPAVVWNGLTNVDDKGSSEVKEFYLDGIKYLSTVSARDWKGALTAYTYPDEFATLLGIGELGDGLFADSQPPGRFGLSYRTMINTPGLGETHYKIHLVYNLMASLSSISNSTLTGTTVDPNQFAFELTAVPVIVPSRRPTAHFIIDSRFADPMALIELEGIIYGTSLEDARLPTVEELMDLLTFADGVVVVYNGDGTWTATGSNENIKMFDFNRTFRIDNVDADYLSPEIYKFNGLDVDLGYILRVDDDGEYYWTMGDGHSNIGLDTDGTPYYDSGASDADVLEDTDGVPYFDS